MPQNKAHKVLESSEYIYDYSGQLPSRVTVSPDERNPRDIINELLRNTEYTAKEDHQLPPEMRRPRQDGKASSFVIVRQGRIGQAIDKLRDRL